MNDKELYAERDIDELGDYYAKHVSAMTTERLHSKSAIAAELAFRDCLIEQQAKEIEALTSERQRGLNFDALNKRIDGYFS